MYYGYLDSDFGARAMDLMVQKAMLENGGITVPQTLNQTYNLSANHYLVANAFQTNIEDFIRQILAAELNQDIAFTNDQSGDPSLALYPYYENTVITPATCGDSSITSIPFLQVNQYWYVSRFINWTRCIISFNLTKMAAYPRSFNDQCTTGSQPNGCRLVPGDFFTMCQIVQNFYNDDPTDPAFWNDVNRYVFSLVQFPSNTLPEKSTNPDLNPTSPCNHPGFMSP
jgi:hypothetical protein